MSFLSPFAAPLRVSCRRVAAAANGSTTTPAAVLSSQLNQVRHKSHKLIKPEKYLPHWRRPVKAEDTSYYDKYVTAEHGTEEWWDQVFQAAEAVKVTSIKSKKKSIGELEQPKSRKQLQEEAEHNKPRVNVLDLVTQEEINRLDPTGWKQKLFARDNKDSVKPGDIVQVRQKDSEPFAGVIINIRRRGVDTAFLLRNTVTRIGVEMWFKLYNPIVEAVELVQRKQPKRARRAKLYYMRKPKHDVGNVQSIVNQYTRQRNRLRGQEQSKSNA